MSNRKVAELGNGMQVWELDIDAVKEQDLNAQVVDKRKMQLLTSNVKSRGALESLPYVYLNEGGGFEIISGHHRVRAANAAGLKTVYALVDTVPMSRSKLVSKQIAHNELVGEPDKELLGQLVTQIKELDDLIASGLPQDFLDSVEAVSTTLDLPSLDFDWRYVQLTFLPKQMERFDTLIKTLDSKIDMVGVADAGQFERFSKAVVDCGRSMDVKSVSTTVAYLTELALEKLEADGAPE